MCSIPIVIVLNPIENFNFIEELRRTSNRVQNADPLKLNNGGNKNVLI